MGKGIDLECGNLEVVAEEWASSMLAGCKRLAGASAACGCSAALQPSVLGLKWHDEQGSAS